MGRSIRQTITATFRECTARALSRRPPFFPSKLILDRLAAAVSYGHLDIAGYLLEKGADVHQRDSDGNTALHFCEDVESAQLLLSHGADPQARNEDGEGAIDSAIDDEIGDLVMLYLGLGCLPKASEDAIEEEDEDQAQHSEASEGS